MQTFYPDEISELSYRDLMDRLYGIRPKFSPPVKINKYPLPASIEDQYSLKIFEIATGFERLYFDNNPSSKLAFIKMVLNYEWNYELETPPGYNLRLLLTIIDNNEDLFPITEKLEKMLREIHPIMVDVFIKLRHNEKLLDICNDVGLLYQNEQRHSLEVSANHYLLLKKGMPCKDQDKYSLYIQSVMITI